jgi:rhamnosyltransferase
MLKIGVVGTRGVPGKYGGFETFVDELLSFKSLELEFTVYCEKSDSDLQSYKNAKLEYLKFYKNRNQILYMLISTHKALKYNDILLITGPALGPFHVFCRLLYPNKTIIVNPDGLEFKRDKWTLPVKFYLKISSYCAILFANIVVADSTAIKNYYLKRIPWLKRKFHVIEYGSRFYPEKESYQSSYFLVVARMVPENNILTIINGFVMSKTVKRLLIISDLPLSKYCNYIKNISSKYNNIELVGPIYDQEKIAQYRINTFAHIHGHSVGGTNPSLLEGMASGNLVIAHNNIFNREVLESDGIYFENANELAKQIDILESINELNYNKISQQLREKVRVKYNWERVSGMYFDLFKSLKK